MNNEKPPKSGWFLKNLANFITLFGFPLCLVLLWVVISHRDWIFTIFFLVIGVLLTDYFDGKTARYLKTTSEFGGAADRLRDKFLLGVMFAFFIIDERTHLSLKITVIPLIIIETLLLGMWFKGLAKGKDVSTPKSLGKRGPGQIKMFLMSVTILLCLVNIMAEEKWNRDYHLPVTIILDLMFAISFWFAIKSFLGHRAKYRTQLSVR
jgi:phosphatidylglycerophosphate synthase